jgi:cellulose synthase/poly-beta-1,6-N-acetylglucosamine synthase-like glycosyltransferase
MEGMLIESVLAISVLLIAYTYAGYPFLVFCLSRLLRRPVRQAEIWPRVSVIIAAYNEESDIAAKIENTLTLDYPKRKLEIIIASDCSSDRTDEIVRSFESYGVKLCRSPHRLGKTAAQNLAVKASTGDVLIFSDATTICRPDVVRRIVRNFADPEVGCVSGQLIYFDRTATAVGQGCRSYWSYEKFLKRCESDLGSLIGVSGCLYAVRRANYVRLTHDMSSDFVIASEIHLQGLRTVYEPNAIALETTNERGKDEFKMRLRVIDQTLGAIYRYRNVLDLRRHRLFALQMISHKLLRYSAPAFLFLAFVSSACLVAQSSLYGVLFVAQVLSLAAAAAGWLAERRGMRLRLLSVPYYFALANLAAVFAFAGYMRGRLSVTWEPSRTTRPSNAAVADRGAL